MFFYDVGFISEVLSIFRVHSQSATHANMVSRQNRFDQLRLLDGLLACGQIRSKYPEIRQMRRIEFAKTITRLMIPLSARRHLHRVIELIGDS